MSTEIPASLPAETPAAKRGCARNALLGCGVVALVLFAVVVVFFLYVRRNPTLLTDLMMKRIESHYAGDVTEQDKADLGAAYAEFRAAVDEKRVDQMGYERLKVTLSSNRSGDLNHEQVRSLIQAFRVGAGKAPAAAPSASASPAPAATPSP